jgi:hypothetical protein
MGADGSRLRNLDDWMERLQNAHHSDRLQQVTVHESRVQSFIARNAQSPFKTILVDSRDGGQKSSCASKAQFTLSPLLSYALRLLHIEGSACMAWLPYKPLIVGLQKTLRFLLALIGQRFQEVFGGAVDGTAQPRSQLFFRCQRLRTGIYFFRRASFSTKLTIVLKQNTVRPSPCTPPTYPQSP